jgi:lipopolysaccharide export system protein LptC
MHLSGNVRAETSAYLLTTESLNYAHQSRMIHIKTPVTLKSALMTLTADAMTYHLATGAITCNGNVNGVFLKPDETPAK